MVGEKGENPANVEEIRQFFGVLFKKREMALRIISRSYGVWLRKTPQANLRV